ncbi:hypothetical protein QTI66_37530 [Variovorax sp. J22R133]|uniref:hypothetical protein n=1 Tax=Variovorax brevis TaxID=3053503 RepID=UPI00257867DF|nr:hypothetical protein [Variovorax sp. J22R133]MDM0117800.1 hypothetical protein [Variovorax sp. J22R133]
MQSYWARMNLPQPVMPAAQRYALLKGQTAVVTRANSGIDRAIRVALGRAGADIVVNYVVNPEDAEAVAQEIRSNGATGHDCPCRRVGRGASASHVRCGGA